MMGCSTSMMCSHGGSGSSAFLLIAVALGYWVLTLADNQTNLTKRIGQVVGWVVMLTALSGFLCISMSRMCKTKMCSTKDGMAMGGMTGCPHMDKMGGHGAGMVPAPQDSDEK